METYLFKFSACLLVFWLVYVLFLERQNMHRFKRFYLLGAVVAALVIPLLTITQYIEPAVSDFEVSPLLIPMETSFAEIPQVQAPFWDLETVLWAIYGLGALLLLTRFVINLSKMYQRITENETTTERSFIYVLLQECRIPHSFFKYIFFNKSAYETHTVPNEVILHEETHAKQLHSLDIIIIELLQIVFWFHPLVYVLKHHIKLNHEFLADQAVLEHGTDTKAYQNILLQFSSNTQNYNLSSAINYSSIKKRFTVMKTQTSKTRIWLSSLFLLPIIAVLFYSFSSKEYIQKETSESSKVDNSGVVAQDDFYSGTETQEKASIKQVEAYNAWAKQLNASDHKIIKQKDLDTYTYIYGIMTAEQKKTSEAFPKLPPPPPMAKKSQEKSGPIEINGANYYFTQQNGKTTYFDQYGKVVDINKIPPPPPIPLEATAAHKAKMETATEAYKKSSEAYEKSTETYEKAKLDEGVTSSEITGYTEINGEKLYYVSEDGRTTYFNRDGKEVKMDNLPPPPPVKNPSFLEFIIEMEQKGASFYMDGKKITAEQAKTIAKSNKGKNTEMVSQLDDNGKYVVKLSKRSDIPPSQLKSKNEKGGPNPSDAYQNSSNYTARSISLKILNDDTYEIDGIRATKNNLKEIVNTLHQDITPAIRNRIMNIHISSLKEVSNKEVWFIYNTLYDYGFYRLVSKKQDVNRAKGNKPFAIEGSNG